jgi:multidrug resistance efflux pump
MSHKRPPILVIVLLVLGLFIAAYYGIRALTQKESASLALSGTIEGEQTSVSAESSGKVMEVFVAEGETVKVGDPLFRLDDTLLGAQRAAASAGVALSRSALAAAFAQFDLVDSAVQLESAPARSALWTAVDPAGYTLPDAYYSQAELLLAAETEMQNAESALEKAQNTLRLKLAEAGSTDFKAAEIALVRERAAAVVAQEALNKARLSQNQDLIDAAQSQLDDFRENLDIAQSNYDDLAESDAAVEIIADRAQVLLLTERAQLARNAWLKLQIGNDSPKWKAASAALEQAHAAVEQANAQLALIDTQITKLTVYAPVDGLVSDVIAQPGEIITIGTPAVMLSKPDSLSIIIYVPEEHIGSIKMDQLANLAVDSFPEALFSARVIHIANEAEFTPRNTSTSEGRKTTVFAVKLKVEDPSGLLKAGMPADLIFLP